MRKHKVPLWMIESCKKIKYMFPKAHAVAYVLMALRLAWFKLYYPEAFYATWLTLEVSDFNYDIAIQGEKEISKYLADFRKREKERKVTAKESDEALVLEVCREMYLRGIELRPPSIFHSDYKRFKVEDKRIRVPFIAIQGIGEKVAEKIATEIKSGGITSIDDLVIRASIPKSVVEKLKRYGIFENLPESSQMKFF